MSDFDDDALDDEIAVIRGEIWDNCRDWCYKCDIAYPENEVERNTTHCKCGRVLGFIPRAGINEYLKTLDPEEREAREKGVWRHLSGLVYKELDRSAHIYEDFPVPKSWMKIESVDPHDARETHWAFGAVSPEEIEVFGKKRNRIYWFDQLLLKGSVEEMTKQVKSLRALHGYTEPKAVVLDRKMGEKTQMEGVSWEGRLGQAGIGHIRLSQSSPGDVELGHKIVRAYLATHYSNLTQSAKPGMMFAKKACGGQKGIIRYMFNYQYDPDSQKPREEYKDWPDCYDQETEVLTAWGWTKFSKLDRDYSVLTFDTKSGTLEYQLPTDHIQHHYSGPMVLIEGRSSNLLVTPKHNMVVGNSGGPVWPNVHWHFRKASELSKTMLIPTASNGVDSQPADYLPDDYFRFMGWYLSEGSATGTKGGKIQVPGRGYSVYISQSENSPHVAEIKSLLDRLALHYRYDGRNFVMSNKAIWEILYPLGNSHEKYIPPECFYGTKDQMMLLWDSFVKGDGWEYRKKNITSRTACTVSPRLADDLQRLLVLCGKSASIRQRKPNRSFLNGREIKEENCSLQYHVTEKTTKYSYLADGDKKEKFRTVDYDGEVYCVTVPNHALVVRRNDVVSICGNCIRYAALEQFVYRSPEDEAGIVNSIEDRMKAVYASRRR